MMIMGVGAALGDILVAPGVFVDYAIMIAFSFSLLAAARTGTIGRIMGALLAAGYVTYLLVSFFAWP